jgi:Sulfotransferase family
MVLRTNARASASETQHETAPPIFILTAARSGSTLLRHLLNNHPAVACPAETNLAGALSLIATACRVLNFEPRSGREEDGRDGKELAIPGSFDMADSVELAASTQSACRTVGKLLLGQYAARHNKSRWCDKSLTSARVAELLFAVYPEAQFICLYRHPLDSIASLIEATPYWCDSYGLGEYFAREPQNRIEACGRYWLDNTRAVHAFQTRHPGACLGVRYEALVGSPADQVNRVLRFLRLDGDAAELLLSAATASRAQTRGDHKLQYRDAIDESSVGRGWVIPVHTCSKRLRAELAELATRLGYDDIRVAANRIVWRGTARSRVAEEQCRSMDELFELRMMPRMREMSAGALAELKIASLRRCVIRVIDWSECFDVEFARGHIERRPWSRVENAAKAKRDVLASDCRTLLGIANREINLGTALRLGSVRFLPSGADDVAYAGRGASDSIRREDTLDALLALLT